MLFAPLFIFTSCIGRILVNRVAYVCWLLSDLSALTRIYVTRNHFHIPLSVRSQTYLLYLEILLVIISRDVLE